MNIITEINYEINPNIEYWETERDFDAIAVEFNDMINIEYPDIDLINFVGCNSTIIGSIIINVNYDVKQMIPKHYHNEVFERLHEIWQSIDFSDEKFFK